MRGSLGGGGACGALVAGGAYGGIDRKRDMGSRDTVQLIKMGHEELGTQCRCRITKLSIHDATC